MSMFAEFRKALSVSRPGAGSYVDGVWVDGTPDEIEISASVQPATVDDLQSLPENRRNRGVFRLYSDVPFQTVIEGERNPDVVTINGDRYEIASCNPWENGLIKHYKSMAVRI